ncbi:complement resistance protein TraT (plasmid) [Legionella lytica]|uniref:Complement resistance protein TraT n=1 Tax=Legionella lytica TaxID=96232 RepID=A0ABY4YD54_9GAMM|nr:complement resistance protein TraT [Legionella lytica]USQ15567.1 complement resistance protein TraT [Legionella lytica]
MKQYIVHGFKVMNLSACVGAIVLLTSCAATQTALEHRNLEVNTKLSKTIFLDPVSPAQKTIFVAVKNTSDEDFELGKPLTQSLTANGYRVVTNPNQAHYLIQANILKVGKMSRSASQNALGGGYGSALAGAGTGAALGAFGNSKTMLAGGIVGGVVGLAADSLIKEVNYTVITDVQISERVGKGVTVKERFNSALENGTASSTHQTSYKHSDYQRYRTRVVSNANKMNLSFAQARPVLEQGLVKTISGIF